MLIAGRRSSRTRNYLDEAIDEVLVGGSAAQFFPLPSTTATEGEGGDSAKLCGNGGAMIESGASRRRRSVEVQGTRSRASLGVGLLEEGSLCA